MSLLALLILYERTGDCTYGVAQVAAELHSIMFVHPGIAFVSTLNGLTRLHVPLRVFYSLSSSLALIGLQTYRSPHASPLQCGTRDRGSQRTNSTSERNRGHADV